MLRSNLVLIIFAILFLVFSKALTQEKAELEPWLDLIQDDPTLAEILNELIENPIAINQANQQEWQRIPLLTQQDIENILQVRKQQGAFSTIRQIRKIIGKEKYQLIKPFLILKAQKVQKVQVTQRNYWTVETPEEIRNQKFLGNKLYNLTQFRYQKKGKWEIGLVVQKDVGEPEFNDYWNASAVYHTLKWQLLIGSFYLQIGQGLLFSSPFGKVKSSVVMLPFTPGVTFVRPYLGTSENFAQTGICLKGKPGLKTEVLAFGASNLRDGKFNPSTQKVIGFDFSGYHRSATERNRKDLIREKIFGLHVRHQLNNSFMVQGTLVKIDYSPGIEFNAFNVPFSDLRRKFYDFSGQRIILSSFAYDFKQADWHFSGEIAGGKYTAPGLIQSLWLEKEQWQTGLIFWNLSRNFQSPYGRVLGQSNPFPRALRGLYFALAWQKEKWDFSFYKIITQNLWRTYRNPFPGLKDEWLARARLEFNHSQLLIRWREKTTDEAVINSSARLDNVRIQFNTLLAKKIELRSRLEAVRLKNSAEKGVLTFQQINCRISREWQFLFRVTFFRTDSYNSRIYEYENDVPGSFANYPLYGEGFKWFWRVQWQPFNNLKIWIKYRYLMIMDRLLTDIDYGLNSRTLKRLIRVQFRVTL